MRPPIRTPEKAALPVPPARRTAAQRGAVRAPVERAAAGSSIREGAAPEEERAAAAEQALSREPVGRRAASAMLRSKAADPAAQLQRMAAEVSAGARERV